MLSLGRRPPSPPPRFFRRRVLAGLSPNSSNISRTKRATTQTSGLVVHPEYQYWRPEWLKIRDVLAGQREIKAKGTLYLRPLQGQDRGEYEQYLYRALFYNMADQTLSGMVGQMFRRAPVIRGLPAKFKDTVRRFAKDGTSHIGLAKTAAAEQASLGRFGILVDCPAQLSTTPTSYAIGYTAENICDWTIEEINGFYQPTRILLREFQRWDDHALPSQNNPWIGREQQTRSGKQSVGAGNVQNAPQGAAQGGHYASSYMYRTLYRELILEPQYDAAGEIVGRIYKQHVYVENPTSTPRDTFTPMVRGQTLDAIPFVFFGASGNTADCEKPPILDIVDLNLSHYRTYAELEHGRFYTAMPTYYAPGNQDADAAEYHIGPSNVWEVPSGETPGIIEFKGEGLKTLERALNTKEQQIAAIGGRLLPGTTKSVSESNNQSAMREANEQSLLLNLIMALEDGMAQVLRYWLMFRDIPLSQTEGLIYEIDTTFLSVALDARAMRAIQMLYESGMFPVDLLYEYLLKCELIPQDMGLDDFKTKMEDPDSFIGQPDAMAMRRGYATRAQELEQSRTIKEQDFQQQELDLQADELDLQKKQAADAAKAAKVNGPQVPTVPQPALTPRPKRPPKPGAPPK
jgi:hypothetical protein